MFKSEDLAEQGKPILQAISSITQPTLSYLDLGENEELWKDDANFDMVLNILQQQHNLCHLDLNWSLFSELQTEELLRRITGNNILYSLSTLNLSAANFDSDESVNLLALILAKAHRIKHVDITML